MSVTIFGPIEYLYKIQLFTIISIDVLFCIFVIRVLFQNPISLGINVDI